MKTIDELQAEIAGLKAILHDKDKEIKTLEKVKKENLKIELKETFEEEQRKSDKIKEFKKFLNEDNEK